jgi:hypothetical protein
MSNDNARLHFKRLDSTDIDIWRNGRELLVGRIFRISGEAYKIQLNVDYTFTEQELLMIITYVNQLNEDITVYV